LTLSAKEGYRISTSIPPLRDYFADLRASGDPSANIQSFLAAKRPDTWQHVQAVASVASDLAARFGMQVSAAQIAGLGHDLAAVVPRSEMVAVAEAWRVSLTPADREIPQIIHGPLAAAVMAQRLSIADQTILDAVRYHTTLRPRPLPLDLVVFIADKVAYDLTTPRVDYLAAVQEGLKHSLEAAAYAYLDFVVVHQVELGWRIHPLLLAAHRDLGGAQ